MYIKNTHILVRSVPFGLHRALVPVTPLHSIEITTTTTMFATSAKTSSFVAGAAAMKTTARKTGATTKRYETRDATTSDEERRDEERRRATDGRIVNRPPDRCADRGCVCSRGVIDES